MWVLRVRSEPARSTRVRREVWIDVGSYNHIHTTSQHSFQLLLDEKREKREDLREKTYIPLPLMNPQNLNSNNSMTPTTPRIRKRPKHLPMHLAHPK